MLKKLKEHETGLGRGIQPLNVKSGIDVPANH